MTDTIGESFGKILKKFREEQGLTQAELAQKIGLKREKTLLSWESRADLPMRSKKYLPLFYRALVVITHK